MSYIPILNQNSFDLSDYTTTPPKPREWYCKSKKCCEYISRTTEVFDKKTNEKSLYHFYDRRAKVLKLVQFTVPRKCPECGEPLFGTTVQSVKRKVKE